VAACVESCAHSNTHYAQCCLYFSPNDNIFLIVKTLHAQVLHRQWRNDRTSRNLRLPDEPHDTYGGRHLHSEVSVLLFLDLTELYLLSALCASLRARCYMHASPTLLLRYSLVEFVLLFFILITDSVRTRWTLSGELLRHHFRSVHCYASKIRKVERPECVYY